MKNDDYATTAHLRPAFQQQPKRTDGANRRRGRPPLVTCLPRIGSQDQDAVPLPRMLAGPGAAWTRHDEGSRGSGGEEMNAIAEKQRRYYRCECGGLIVRGDGNDNPCEVCGRPLGNELCVDVHWWIEAQNAKAEIERLRAELAMLRIEAAEKARTCK